MPAAEAIFFDIGDTLVFDRPPLRDRVAAAAQAAGLGHDPERLPDAFRAAEAFAVRRYAQGVAWDAPGALRQTLDFLQRAMDRPPADDARWAAFAGALAAAPFTRVAHPDAPALLRALRRRGFTLGVISDWEETLPDVLESLGLLPFFDTLSVSALVGAAKPDVRLFRDALSRAGKSPGRCLHVGDWYELDAAGARAAGMSPLLFDWAGRCPEADCPRVTSFPELADYLLALDPPRPPVWGGQDGITSPFPPVPPGLGARELS